MGELDISKLNNGTTKKDKINTVFTTPCSFSVKVSVITSKAQPIKSCPSSCVWLYLTMTSIIMTE